MKKVLFVIMDFHPNISAAGNCVMHICSYLSENNLEVHVMCLKRDFFEEDKSIFNGVRIHRITYEGRITRSSFEKIWRTNKTKFIVGIAKKIIYRLLSYRKMIDNGMVHCLSQSIQELHGYEVFDCVIPVAVNIEPTLAVIKNKSKLSRIGFYQVDKYTDNQLQNVDKRRQRFNIEKDIYKNVDFIITTPWSRLYDKALINHNVIECGIPYIRKITHCKKNEFKTTGINCVYAGLLDDEVRDSSYFISLIKMLDKDSHSINFHFFCFGDLTQLLKLQGTCGNIFLHPPVSQQELALYFESADVLINIENNKVGQVPSKVFEYISTGKAIVSFRRNTGDQTAFYLSRYPNCLIISEHNSLEVSIKQFREFCNTSSHVKINYLDIEKTFYDNTEAYVGNLFKKAILNE